MGGKHMGGAEVKDEPIALSMENDTLNTPPSVESEVVLPDTSVEREAPLTLEKDLAVAEPAAAEKIEEQKAAGQTEAAELLQKMQEKMGVVTPEALKTNMEALKGNIGKIDQIPKVVFESPEGKKETQSLLSKMTGGIRDMGNNLVERLSKLKGQTAQENVLAYGMFATLATMIAPAILQYARSKYPEVGVAIDSAPDALQQIINFDMWSHVVNLFSNSLIHSTSEFSNLMADISSGKVDINALSMDQMDLVGVVGDIKRYTEVLGADATRHYIGGQGGAFAVAKGFANFAVFGSAAVAAFGLSGTIGKWADNKLKANS